MKKALSLLLVVLMLVGMLPMTVLNASAAAESVARFEFGTNGAASHKDGSTAKTTYTETVNGYTLDITGGDKMYPSSYDAKGNSCIKLGTSSVVGRFQFVVPNDVTEVVIYVAKYKTNTTKMNINETAYTLTQSSNDGAYDAITIDTSSVKTVTVTTVSGGVRAMVNSIEYIKADSGDADCTHANTVAVDAVAATCTTPGFTAGKQCTDCEAYTEGHEVVPATGHTMGDWDVVTAASCTEAGEQTRGCANCELVETQAIAALGHNYENGVCTGCGNVAVMTQYELVTDAASLKAGDQLVFVGANADGAYSAMLAYVSGGNNLKAETINAPVDGKISLPDTSAAAIITLGGDSAGWTLSDGTYYLYSAGTTKSNHLKGADALKDDNTTAWTIAIDENGLATIVNVGNNAEGARNVIKFNYGNSPVLFANYASTYVTKVNPISIYRLADGSSEGGEGGSEACTHANQTTTTVDATCTEAGSVTIVCDDCGETVSTEVIEALGHNYVDNVCSRCGTEFEGEIDTPDPETPAEDVKIIFQLGENKEAAHADGTTATEYTETVDGYTLNITEGNKMYTGAADATGNGCIKLGTSSAVGGFEFTVPSDVREVVICVAKYKANATKINVNGTEYTLNNASNDGAYDEIVIDTTSNKTVTLTTVSGGVRAMVNSITFVCGEKDHECQWDNGTVTKEATCTEDGVRTFSCTVEGCTETKTEKIPGGHIYDADGNCTACDLTAAKIVEMAYALESGKALEGKYTLTGVIKGVHTAYDAGYQNVSVIIDVIGVTDMPILCYRMKGEGADQIGAGDTITVTGVLKNYNGTIEFDAGCTLDKWEDTGSEFVRPETVEDIVNAAYALEVNTTLEAGPYTLTGVITSVDYAYNAEKQDITIVIQIGEMADKLIKCYRLKGEGAELICVGDTVTVTGNLKNYNGTVEFDSGCTLDSYEINKGHTEVIDAAVDATCTEAGKTEGEHCSVCNLVIVAQEDVDALGHTMVDGVCTVCNYDENLKFATVSLSFQEYIGVQPLVVISNVSEYDEVYVESVQVSPEGTVEETLSSVVLANYYYVFDKQVLSWSMTEEITVTLYGVKDGVVYQGECVTTSVKALAMEKLAAYKASGNTKACRILVDMLTYGAEVQKAFSHNTTSLPDTELTDYSELGSSGVPTVDASYSSTGEATISVAREALSMQSKVEIQFVILGDMSQYELRYTVDDETTVVPSTEFVYGEGNAYTITRAAIKAANMRKDHTMALYNKETGEAVTKVYTISVEALAVAQLGGTYNDVVIAMMNYGDAVAAL